MSRDLNLDDPIEGEISAALISLVLDHPWYGNMALGLKVVDSSSWLRTVATDGKHLFYNRDFFKSKSRHETLFIIGHEVLHMVLGHIGRRGGRDKDIFSMACDYLINYILKKGGAKGSVGRMPSEGLYDSRYNDEMSAEEIYDLLKKDSVEIKMPLDEHLQLGEDSDDEDGDGQPKEGNGGDGNVNVTLMGKDGPPKLTKEELDAIRSRVRAQAIQAAQATQKAGDVPLGVRRMLDDLLEPKLDWRTMLDAHLRSAIKDDYTYQRISRRSWSGDWLMPSQDVLEEIKIHVFLDGSSSTTREMITEMLSEVKGIMETWQAFTVKLHTFDTRVYTEMTFTADNLNDIDNYPFEGGGGTSFECIFEHLAKNDEEPDRLLVFTDGYPNAGWGEDLFPTLFIIHGNRNIKPPYGQVAYYDDMG